MEISEKVAYLKGLAEGMGMDDSTKEGKLIRVITDILEDVALELQDLGDNALDLAEEIDELSDDLAVLEEEIYGDDCCCCEEHDDDEDEGEPVFYAVTCEACGNEITVDEDVLDLGSIECPHCGEIVELNASTVAPLDDGDED